MKRVLAVGALGLWLTWVADAGVAQAAQPPLDPKADVEIEAALPAVESARLAGHLIELHARYADRNDRAGQILAAWTLSEDQAVWSALKQLTAFDRPEPWVEVGQAVVYLRWKTWDQATLSLQKAHSLAPNLAHAYDVEGDLDRLQGNTGPAEAAYRKALALRPSDTFALDGLGALAAGSGNAAEAERNFTAAHSAYADDPVAAQGLEAAHLARGDVAGALAALDDEHRLLPNDAEAWLRSGKLRLKQGDPTGAARDFEAARKLGSTDPDLLKLLSETYKSQGRLEDERHLLDELIGQGQASPAQYARRAELREAKDQPGALADLRKAVELSKDDPDLVLRLAALTAASGDLSNAIGLYRQVAETKPDAKPALAALETQVGLSKKPLKGTIAQINTALSAELNRLYRQLLKKQPGLAGSLKLRIAVNAKGGADDEDLLEDTVKSPELAANLRWNAHDAHYPPQAARYTLKFSLQP